MAKKIGVLGSGIVGQTLASGFLKHGYDVMIGTAHEAKLKDWKAANPHGKTGSFEETARFGQILVLAAKGTAAEDVLNLAGLQNLEGKTILDTCNPIADAPPPQNGVLKFFTDLEESLMERFQIGAPKAHFVKAFNSVGSALMVNPDFGGTKPTMFICGDNAASKKEAAKIIEQFGWEYEDMGASAAARAIEPLCMLWCIPGFARNQWSHAFKLLKK